MRKKDDSGIVKEIVSEEEIKLIKYEIKALLLIKKVNKTNLLKKLFKIYKDDAKLNIKELIDRLSKKPLNLSFTKSEILARYIIEPREKSKIEYNTKKKKEIKEIKEELDKLLDINYEFTTEEEYEEAIKEALEAVAPKFIKIKEDFGVEPIDLDKWQKVFKNHFSELEELYEDVLLSIAFDPIRGITNLSLDVTSIKNI